MVYISLDVISRSDIRYLAEEFAPLYSNFCRLFQEETRRIGPGTSQPPTYFASIYAANLQEQLAAFKQKVPDTLVAIVNTSLETMDRAASMALNPGTPLPKRRWPLYNHDSEMEEVRMLVYEYARLCFAYDNLITVRDEGRGGPVEMDLAIELGTALETFIANVPQPELHKIVEDRWKEMFMKVSAVISRIERQSVSARVLSGLGIVNRQDYE